VQDVVVSGNIVRGCTGNGVCVEGGASGTISDNEVSGGESNGIVVVGVKTAPVLRANRIFGNAKTGILIHKKAGGTVENNDIHNNRGCGVGITGSDTNPTLRGNEIHENNKTGVKVEGGAGGTLEGNHIHKNGKDGVHVAGEQSSTVLRSNRVRGNTLAGIKVEEASVDYATAVGNISGVAEGNGGPDLPKAHSPGGVLMLPGPAGKQVGAVAAGNSADDSPSTEEAKRRAKEAMQKMRSKLGNAKKKTAVAKVKEAFEAAEQPTSGQVKKTRRRRRVVLTKDSLVAFYQKVRPAAVGKVRGGVPYAPFSVCPCVVYVAWCMWCDHAPPSLVHAIFVLFSHAHALDALGR
jgi:parallel beta-helix repeat protein